MNITISEHIGFSITREPVLTYGKLRTGYPSTLRTIPEKMPMFTA